MFITFSSDCICDTFKFNMGLEEKGCYNGPSVVIMI